MKRTALDKLRENIKTVHGQLEADLAAADPKAQAFAKMCGAEINAARKSLGITTPPESNVNESPAAPPLPNPRTGKKVSFRPPKAVGGPSIQGTVEGEVWTGPHLDPAWGYYAFFSELIRWDDQSRSIRLSYYYWPLGRRRWIFGGQFSLEGTPSEIHELLKVTLEQVDWFRQ